jgi:hypothetical protein
MMTNRRHLAALVAEQELAAGIEASALPPAAVAYLSR